MLLDDGRTDCYRDLAISYARLGQIDNAADTLKKAIKAKVSNDQTDLMNGEIEIARGNYAKAVEYIRQAVSETDNEYLLFRALMVYVDICNMENTGIEEPHLSAVAMLSENLDRVSLSYINYIYEILANQYTYVGREKDDHSYYRKAVQYYEKLMDSSAQTYAVYSNCYDIQFVIKDYEGCLRTLGKMEKNLPADYRIMMNYSYVYIELQNDVLPEQRDYDNALKYYNEAKKLYEGAGKEKKADPNMAMLDSYIQQLKDGGWLNTEG